MKLVSIIVAAAVSFAICLALVAMAVAVTPMLIDIARAIPR